MSKKPLRAKRKQNIVGLRRGRRLRPIAVEPTPAARYPADSRTRLRSAATPFAAHAIRELLEQGVLVEVDGRIILAKEHTR